MRNKNKDKSDDNSDSEKPLKALEQKKRVQRMIDRLFNFVFAGFLFYGKLTVSIGSKLWLLKAKFLLAVLTALLSLMSYRVGSDNSKRTTILKPSHELIQLNKTLEMLPELHRSFISQNQDQLYQLSQNLEALQNESRAKRESMLQLRRDFLKATQALEINYEVIVAEKKDAANLKTLLSQKAGEFQKLQTQFRDLEIRNKKSELEFQKKLWKRQSKISNLEEVITDSRNSPNFENLVRERSYSSMGIGISETSSHIEKIQVGDKILVLGSKPLKPLKPLPVFKKDVINMTSRKKRFKAKMMRFSDLPKLGELNDSQEIQDSQILLPRSTSSRLRIRTK